MKLSNHLPQIVIDSREQRPYDFPGAIRKALPAGDYSLEGCENKFAIERKSLPDWINTLLRGKRRFGRELEKLKTYDFACIVVESTVEDILAGDYKSELNPKSLLGLTVAIMHGFHPVHVILGGDRPHSFELVKTMLELARVKYKGEQDGTGY